MKKLSKEQKSQEEEYFFPYHYLDLYLDSYKNLYSIPRENLLFEVKKILSPKKK